MEGIILAGGRSRRMNGAMKALLPVGGSPIISRAAAAMDEICFSVRAVVADREQAEALAAGGFAFPVAVETVPGRGPLAGLQHGLRLAQSELLWLAACDMPFVCARAAALLADRLCRSGALAAVPRIEGRLQPLHAVYRTGCLPVVDACLKREELRMNSLLGVIDTVVVDEADFRGAGIEPAFATNVNKPEQYEAIALNGRYDRLAGESR